MPRSACCCVGGCWLQGCLPLLLMLLLLLLMLLALLTLLALLALLGVGQRAWWCWSRGCTGPQARRGSCPWS